MLDKNINEFLQRGEFKKTLKILEDLIKNGKQDIWLFFYLLKYISYLSYLDRKRFVQ